MGERIHVPPERYITTSFFDLLDNFQDELGGDLKTVGRLLDCTGQFEFLPVRRRLKRNFDRFALAAAGKAVPTHKSTGLSDEEWDRREARFMDDFYKLMSAAHFRVLTRQDWDMAMAHDFTFTNPLEVAWGNMDTGLLRPFWERHPKEAADTAPISERVLVFHRGIHVVKAKGMFVSDKIDLLVLYLIVQPCMHIIEPLMERFGVDLRKLQPKVDVEEHVVDHGWSPEKDPKLRHEEPAAGPDPALQHANAQARRCA